MHRLVGSKQSPRALAPTSPPPSSAPHFIVPCLVMGVVPYVETLVAAAAELHLHPAVVTCIVLAVSVLFYWSVLSINLLVARRHAEEETKPHPRPAAATAGAAPTSSASRLACTLFLVLCLVMGALPYAEPLVAASSELQLHPAVIACIFLAVAALFHWAILSLNLLIARRQAEEGPKPQPRPATATTAPTASALSLARPLFLVLCLVMGVLPYAEPLVAAASGLQLHAAVIACIFLAVAALFHWAILSLNLLIARRQAEEGPKPQPQPQPRPATATTAPTASALRLAPPLFLVLCLVMGALPYAEPLVAAASGLQLHAAVIACIYLAVAALFHWAILSLNLLIARRQAEEGPKPQPRPATATTAPTATTSSRSPSI